MKKTDEVFMHQALIEAHEAFATEDVPVGAVLVHEGKVIAHGRNQVELLHDPTAHAEMIAITSAAGALRSKWLHDCTLYVTIEPCSMCAGALILSRIPRVVFGAADPKTGAFGSRLDVNKLRLNHRIKIKRGILEPECASLIKEFFRSKRKIGTASI